MRNLTDDEISGKTILTGLVYLNHWTEIPENYSPIIIGSLFLGNVKMIPKTFNPIITWDLYLRSLNYTTDDFNPIVGGKIYTRNGIKSGEIRFCNVDPVILDALCKSNSRFKNPLTNRL